MHYTAEMTLIRPSLAIALVAVLLALATVDAGARAAAQAAAPTNPAATKRIELAGGAVSFVVPADFTELSEEETALKFPRQQPPRHAYGNSRRSVTVAVTFSPAAVTMEQLPEMKQALEEMMPKMMPGLEWVARDILMINGRRWVYLAALTPAVDTTIHNDMLMTSFEGRALMLNLNATVAEYESAKPQFGMIRESLRVTR